MIKNNKIISQPQTGGEACTLRENLQLSSHSLERKDGIPQSKNLREDFEIGDVSLKNFINLTTKEKDMILTWRNDERARRWMYSDHIISPEEHSKFMEGIEQDSKNFYWLARHKNGEYLGVISLNKLDFRNKNGYLGIYSNPELSGIGDLLMGCLKRLAFDVAHLHKLNAEVIEINERAVSFYKKSGFSEEGRLKEFVFKDGRWCDVIVMGIINHV